MNLIAFKSGLNIDAALRSGGWYREVQALYRETELSNKDGNPIGLAELFERWANTIPESWLDYHAQIWSMVYDIVLVTLVSPDKPNVRQVFINHHQNTTNPEFRIGRGWNFYRDRGQWRVAGDIAMRSADRDQREAHCTFVLNRYRNVLIMMLLTNHLDQILKLD